MQAQKHKLLAVPLLHWLMEGPPLISNINALTLQDFKHDCRTIGMFSNSTIPSAIRREKLLEKQEVSNPSKSMYVHHPLSRCKTSVQIYLFHRAAVIFKDHLVWGEGWMMAAERRRPWRCKNINWLTFPSRRQFDHSLFTQNFWLTDSRWQPSRRNFLQTFTWEKKNSTSEMSKIFIGIFLLQNF